MPDRLVLHIHLMDLAGAPYRMEAATNEYLSGWRAARIQMNPAFGMGFPRGTPPESAHDLLDQADVLHFHHIYAYLRLKNKFPAKPTVVTVHGAPDRQSRPKIDESVLLNTVQPDLLKIWPWAIYIPFFVLQRDVIGRTDYAPVSRPRMYQPVPHSYKNAPECQTVAKLVANVCSFQAQAGSHTKVLNQDQLREISKSHFVWDNLQGYHGVTAVESFAHGAIPITNLGTEYLDEMIRFFGARPPFAVNSSSPEKIAARIRSLASSPETLAEARKAVREFWLKHWRDDQIIQYYRSLYEVVL